MKCLFRLPWYTLLISCKREKKRVRTVTAAFDNELSKYESLGILHRLRKRYRLLGRLLPEKKSPDTDAHEQHEPSRISLIPNGHRKMADRKDTLALFHLAHRAISEIRPGLKSAGGKKLEKVELLFSIRLLLQKYPALFAARAFPFQVAINNVIIDEMAQLNSLHLDQQDLRQCWSPQ